MTVNNETQPPQKDETCAEGVARALEASFGGNGCTSFIISIVIIGFVLMIGSAGS